MLNTIKIFVMIGLLSMTSCRPESFEVDMSMIIDSYELGIFEPSGLSYSADKSTLFTVSDRGSVYEFSLTGDLIRKIPYTGDDFEAITIDYLSSDIYICEEGKGDIVKVNNNGTELERYNILTDLGNLGLEGLTYNINRNELYLLKEKIEGLLITYSPKNNTKTQIKLDFAYDYSGIYYNPKTDKLWIVSDESKTLTKCSLNGEKITTYDIPISGMEGIVVNDDETEAYIVSDPNNKLYLIDLESY